MTVLEAITALTEIKRRVQDRTATDEELALIDELDRARRNVLIDRGQVRLATEETRRCEGCDSVLPPGWPAVYCSNECAADDA